MSAGFTYQNLAILCYSRRHIIGDHRRLASLWLVKLIITQTVRHFEIATLRVIGCHAFGAVCLTSKVSRIHTHTRLTALLPGLLRWASPRRAKPIWILLKQKTVSGSGISWAICKSAPRPRQMSMPAPHHSVFYRLDALPAAQPTASKHWRPKVSRIVNNIYLWFVSVAWRWRCPILIICKNNSNVILSFYSSSILVHRWSWTIGYRAMALPW